MEPRNWELEHQVRQEEIKKALDKIYAASVREAADIGASVTDFNPDKPFNWNDYTSTKARVDAMNKALAQRVQTVITTGSKIAWEQANMKNDALAKWALGLHTPAPAQPSTNGAAPVQLDLFAALPAAVKELPTVKKLFNNNEGARAAFLERKTDGLKLSDRVWNYTNQFKTEIEMGLDDGIRNGKPAAEIARDLRQFLKEPDRVYRRFQMYLRDADGNPVLDRNGNKIMIKQQRRQYIDPATGAKTWKVEKPGYHPGRGVYRSSYKNAQRLARTEVNMAYRTADHIRSQQFDFVVGVKIDLSKSHPKTDICDTLKGRYPKEFKYTGWHTHCYCPMTFIMKTPDELAADTEKILAGIPTDGESVLSINQMPDNFDRWITANRDRYQNGASAPYFIRDNYDGGKIDNGLRFDATPPTAPPVVPASVQATILRNQRATRATPATAPPDLFSQPAPAPPAPTPIPAPTPTRYTIEQASTDYEAARMRAANYPPNDQRRTARQARIDVVNTRSNLQRMEREAAASVQRVEQAVIQSTIPSNETPREAATRTLHEQQVAEYKRYSQRKVDEARRLGIATPELDATVVAIATSTDTNEIATVTQKLTRQIAKEKRRVREAEALAARTGTAAVQTEAQLAAEASAAQQRISMAERAAARTQAAGIVEQQDAAILAEREAVRLTGGVIDWSKQTSTEKTEADARVLKWAIEDAKRVMKQADKMGFKPTAYSELNYSVTMGHGADVLKYRTSELSNAITVENARLMAESMAAAKRGTFAMNDATRKELEKKYFKISITDDEWNQNMESFDLLKLNEEIEALSKKYGITLTSKEVVGGWGEKIKMEIRGHRAGNGDTEFILQRQFIPKGVKGHTQKTVSHEYLTVPDELQGKNLTKELFSSLYTQYKNGGFERLEVHANIDVGSYAWGRYGFTANKDQNSKIKGFFTKRRSDIYNYPTQMLKSENERRAKQKLPPTTVAIMNKELDDIDAYLNKNDGKLIDMHKVSGMPGAKTPLLNKHWFGHLDLTKPDQRQVFEEYISRRK